MFLEGVPIVVEPSLNDPPWLVETRFFDLYRLGDETCVHDFPRLTSSSGMYTTVLENQKQHVAWMKAESSCQHCTARVGRRSELVTVDEEAS